MKHARQESASKVCPKIKAQCIAKRLSYAGIKIKLRKKGINILVYIKIYV